MHWGNKHESSTSTTYSAIGTNIDLTTKTGEMPTALSRDTDNANQKVQQYDLTEVQENQEIASLAGQIGATAVGDLAKAMKWEDGSPQKIALHGLVGYLSAQLSGGNGAAGAAAGMTTEWLNTQVENYLLQQEAKGELSDDSRKAIQQASSALIGAVTGGVIGGDRETAAQGATTALNAEKYNRQLHPDERKRIKVLATQLADKYKSTNPTLTEAFWENQLSMVASAMVDEKNNAIATAGINTLANVNLPTVSNNPNNVSYLDTVQLAYDTLQKEAQKNQTIKWSDGTNMTLYGENLTMFKATEKQYKDHDMLSSSYSTLLDGVGSVKPNTGISSMSDLGRKLGVTDGNVSHTADLLNIISKSKSTNINVLDKVQSDHFSYIDSPNGVVKPVIFEDLLIAGGGKAINWAAGKVISGTNKGLAATGETIAAAMVTDDMIRLGTAAELEFGSMLSKLGNKVSVGLANSVKSTTEVPLKITAANMGSAGFVSIATEMNKYTRDGNSISVTGDNIANSIYTVMGEVAKAGVWGNAPLPISILGSSVFDYTLSRDAKVIDNTGSAIVGDAMTHKLPNSPASIFFREGSLGLGKYMWLKAQGESNDN